MKQVRCLALAVFIFCLTIVACNVCVSFLNACYVGFGPVFFCTYKECKALTNLSGSPQGHPLFDILATPCGVHVAQPQHSCRIIHTAEIILSHSSGGGQDGGPGRVASRVGRRARWSEGDGSSRSGSCGVLPGCFEGRLPPHTRVGQIEPSVPPQPAHGPAGAAA